MANIRSPIGMVDVPTLGGPNCCGLALMITPLAPTLSPPRTATSMAPPKAMRAGSKPRAAALPPARPTGQEDGPGLPPTPSEKTLSVIL